MPRHMNETDFRFDPRLMSATGSPYGKTAQPWAYLPAQIRRSHLFWQARQIRRLQFMQRTGTISHHDSRWHGHLKPVTVRFACFLETPAKPHFERAEQFSLTGTAARCRSRQTWRGVSGFPLPEPRIRGLIPIARRRVLP